MWHIIFDLFHTSFFYFFYSKRQSKCPIYYCKYIVCNTTNSTGGEGTSYPSWAPEFASIVSTCLSGVRVVKLHVFTFLVPLRFPRKNEVQFVLTPVYLYWCPTRFTYQMMFEWFNSNRTGIVYPLASKYPFGIFKLFLALIICNSYIW